MHGQNDKPKTKTLLGAKVKLKYANSELKAETVTGIYKGAQAFASEDQYFCVICIDEKKDIDRLIPTTNIIYMDVLEAEVIKIDDDGVLYG